MGIGGAPEIKTELFGIHSIFCWYSLSCAVMGKVCALLWVACALLTTGLPSLTGGCGITARVTMMDGTVETAEEARTLALVGEEVTRVEIWCRNAPPPHSIFHDDTVVFRTSSNSPRFVMTGFGLAEQGAYRCDCSGGGNKLNLLLVPGFADDHFVGTAIEGDTVRLPCQLTNMHPHLSSLYLVQWRRDNNEIGYGNKYSKLPNNSLVIRDFDEEDTGKSFNCYIEMIGSYDFSGEYPESGPRRLLMLEKPDPEILISGGTVGCSASTPFTALYCLTIIYSDGQRMTEKCERREVEVEASSSIQNIICNVTVFSNASVPQSSLQSRKDWKATSVVDCGDPGTPTNGQRTLSGTTYNAGVFYTCNEGYTLQGQQIRICRSTGLWSERLPVCTGAGGDTMKVTGHLMWLAVLAGVLKEQFLF